MPWGDWQFWVATVAAAAALAFVVRPLLPRRRGQGPSASARPRRTELTIRGSGPQRR